jgi:hypothetical protein
MMSRSPGSGAVWAKAPAQNAKSGVKSSTQHALTQRFNGKQLSIKEIMQFQI